MQATIVAQSYSAITCQLIKLENYLNPLKMQEV